VVTHQAPTLSRGSNQGGGADLGTLGESMGWFGGGAVVRWCSLVVGGGEVRWVGVRRVRFWTGLTVLAEGSSRWVEGSRFEEDHQNCVEWLECDRAHSTEEYILSLHF
jgi:hypothetical protein